MCCVAGCSASLREKPPLRLQTIVVNFASAKPSPQVNSTHAGIARHCGSLGRPGPPRERSVVLCGPFDASYVLRSFLNPVFRPARHCVSEHSLQRATHRRPPFLCFCVAAWSVCETWLLRGSSTGARQQWPHSKRRAYFSAPFFLRPFFLAPFCFSQAPKKVMDCNTLSPTSRAGLQNHKPEKECWVAKP